MKNLPIWLTVDPIPTAVDLIYESNDSIFSIWVNENVATNPKVHKLTSILWVVGLAIILGNIKDNPKNDTIVLTINNAVILFIRVIK